MKTSEMALIIHNELTQLIGLEFSQHGHPGQVKLGRAPHWVSELVDVFTLSFREMKIQLVIPKRSAEFAEIKKAMELLAPILEGNILLLADFLPKKARGTLVRFRLPHVTTDGTLYAPRLGLVLAKLTEETQQGPRVIRQKFSSLGLKLAVAHLMGVPWFESLTTQGVLLQKLQELGFPASAGTLSRAVQQLADFEIIHVRGLGPRKTYEFATKEAIWRTLINAEVDTIVERRFAYECPKGEGVEWVYSGESALEIQTDLSSGSNQTIAMTSKAYHLWQDIEPPLASRTNDHPPVTIEIWKSDPTLMSVERCLNPIELSLSLSLRNSVEPRIHLAIQGVLGQYGLDSNLLWRNR